MEKFNKIVEHMDQLDVKGQGCMDDCTSWSGNSSANLGRVL